MLQAVANPFIDFHVEFKYNYYDLPEDNTDNEINTLYWCRQFCHSAGRYVYAVDFDRSELKYT